MKKETISRLVNEFAAVNTSLAGLGNHISEVLEQEKQLRIAMNKFREEKRSEDARRTQFDSDARAKLREIQNNCPHYEFSYYADAAGGNDSCNMCDLCGKEW